MTDDILTGTLAAAESIFGRADRVWYAAVAPTIVLIVVQLTQIQQRLHEAGSALETTAEVLDYLGE